MIDRRAFLKLSGLSALSLSTGCQRGRVSSHRRPNILFIFTDQQLWRAMSCTGNKYLSTPAMDRLAAEGILFSRAYCTSPVCGPARGSMLTSRMPHETGVEWNGQSMNPGMRNMGQIFSENGYRTVWAGKWHLPESYPLRAGSKRREIDGFEVLPFYDSSKNYPEWGYGDVTDGPLADATVEFLSQPQEKPFLMGLSFCNPHDCCYLTRRPKRYPSFDEINEPLPPLPENYEIDPDEPEFTKDKRLQDHYGDELLLSKDWDHKQWRGYIWNYYRMVERVDHALGRVLDSLDKNRMTDDTVIVFTSDHGDGLGSHRWTAKLSLYEEAVRVPFIIRLPGKLKAGRVDRDHLVSQLDVLPTLCDYAGIEKQPEFRGLSLKAIIDNPNGKWRDSLVTELADDNLDKSRKGRMIVTERYKYNIYSHGARNKQLFDLKIDPGEMNNMADDPKMRDVVELHEKLLLEHLIETEDKVEFLS